MTLVFLTGNADKFNETKRLLGVPLVQKKMDLPEIQSLDAHEVMREKLRAARDHIDEPFIIEDTSLYFACMGNSLPGPFVKWFEKSIGNEGMVFVTERLADPRARAVTLFGYYSEEHGEHIFEGEVHGRIVPARGIQDFGWGPIFVPDGHMETFGEMGQEGKDKVSMRARAAEQLRAFLLT